MGVAKAASADAMPVGRIIDDLLGKVVAGARVRVLTDGVLRTVLRKLVSAVLMFCTGVEAWEATDSAGASSAAGSTAQADAATAASVAISELRTKDEQLDMDPSLE